MALIPPERQSQRIRQNPNKSNAQLPDALITADGQGLRVSNTRRSLNDAEDVEERDEDFVESSDSNDDVNVFRPRSSLPMSSVHRWKLSEIVGK